jgi:RNA recognition motif-containing protein
MDKKILQDAFEKFGQVQHVDLPSGKHIAFVTFKSIESAQAAIGKTITLLGVDLLAEERRKNFTQKQNGTAPYRGGGTGFQSRGRGGNRPPMAQRGRGSEQK